MESLIHIICASSVAADFSEHEALKFLNQARTANRKHDVSGMMIYVGGCFLQVLEGKPAMACIDPGSAKALLSIIGRRRWQSDRSGMYRAIRRTGSGAI